MVVTSPPYFGCRCYGDETLGREPDPNDYVNNILEFTDGIYRVLSDSGSFYLNVGDVYFGTKGFSRNTGKYSRKTDHHYKEHKLVKQDGKYLQHKQLLMLPARIAIGMQERGWILRNQIIWEKPNPIPSYSKDRRLPVYEYVYHFVKSKKYHFDYKLAKELGHHRDVIKCGIEAYGVFHQATFPMKLVKPFILTTSKEGDVVLDPFSGAGTVATVCNDLGRKYIGIELSKEYCEVARKRIEEGSYEKSCKPPIDKSILDCFKTKKAV